MAPPRPATTILLLREASTGFEVFMVQRHRKSGFLPNAWVFPGGRVDEGDAIAGHPRLSGGERVIRQLGLPPAEGVAFVVAGVRETFEESGIWLGTGHLPDEIRDPMNRGELAFADALVKHDATVDLDCVRAWSYWVTPKIEPRRYDTRFLVAIVKGSVGRHDEHETVDSAWVSPREAVATDQKIADFPMAPPTWWTLRELAAFESASAVWDSAETRAQRPIRPILQFSESGLQLLLPGNPAHDQPAYEGIPTRVAFDDGKWVAYDGDRAMSSNGY